MFICSCTSELGINNPDKRNENWCWFIDDHTGEGIWIPITNETTIENGQYTLFYSNGNQREHGRLKDSQPIDTITYFDIHGNIISKLYQDQHGAIQAIAADGNYTKYYPTCELASEFSIKNNKITGLRTAYLKDGTIDYKAIHINDSTITRMSYSEGVRIDSFTRINGKLEGLSKNWYLDGQLKSILNYQSNLLSGEGQYFHPNGQLKAIVLYQNGTKQRYKAYDEAGNLSHEFNIDD